jgi:hypothetical protein
MDDNPENSTCSGDQRRLNLAWTLGPHCLPDSLAGFLLCPGSLSAATSFLGAIA